MDAAEGGQPYSFFLSHPLQTDPHTLAIYGRGMPNGSMMESAQLVQRGGRPYLWSRGEDLITDRFPEISGISLPDGTVIDGEILVWKNGAPGSFADL